MIKENVKFMKIIEDFYELSSTEIRILTYLMDGSKSVGDIIRITRVSRRVYYYAQDKLIEMGILTKRKEKKTYRVSLSDKFWGLKNIPCDCIHRKNDTNVAKRVLELF